MFARHLIVHFVNYGYKLWYSVISPTILIYASGHFFVSLV